MYMLIVKGGGDLPCFLWNLISRLQCTNKLEHVTELLRVSGLRVHTGQPRPYLVNFWLKFAKSLKHAQNHG